MKKIVVLGCGLVGRVMAEDLSKDHEVTSVDISKQNLEKKTNRQCMRLKQITFQGEFLPSPRKATTQAHKKTSSQTPSPSW